jgi:tetratricopeptide (TPR) repeat protein
MLVSSYARFANFSGEPELGAELGSEALRLAEHVSDPAHYGEILLAVSGGFGFLGRPAEGVDLLDRLIAPRVRSFGDEPRLLARFHAIRGLLLVNLGRLDEASDEFERATTHARRRGDDFLLLWVEGLLGNLLHHRGDASALEFHARLVARAEERTLHLHRVSGRFSLAELLILSGRSDEALVLVEEALAISRETSAGLNLASRLEMLRAHALLQQGDIARAEQVAAGIASGPIWFSSLGLRLLQARLATARDAFAERERIESLLDGVARDIAAAGALVFAPEVHELRAELARALGDEAGCAHALREAQRLYAEMGADGHVERLARRLDGAA